MLKSNRVYNWGKKQLIILDYIANEIPEICDNKQLTKKLNIFRRIQRADAHKIEHM